MKYISAFCLSIALLCAPVAIADPQSRVLSDHEKAQLDCSLLQLQAAVFSLELDYPSVGESQAASLLFDQTSIDLRKPLLAKIEGHAEFGDQWRNAIQQAAKLVAADERAKMADMIQAANTCAGSAKS
ncbi:MAG: hypothetical protein AAGH90_03205 [Pseudomonadota bacterium]